MCMTGLAAKFLTENTYDYLNARLVANIESSSAPLQVRKSQKSLFDSKQYLHERSGGLMGWSKVFYKGCSYLFCQIRAGWGFKGYKAQK